MKDTEELINASDLLANIIKFKKHLCDYNIDDFICIFRYKEDNSTNMTVPIDILDLDKLFTVTKNDVTKLYILWRSVVSGDKVMVVIKNLRISLLFSKNNIDPKLHTIVMDELENVIF